MPDMVGAFEEANHIKVESKYYTGGDNMLALIAQSPPGTYDVILSDAEYVTQLGRLFGADELIIPLPIPRARLLGRRYGSFGFLGMTYNTVSENSARLWDHSVAGKAGTLIGICPRVCAMAMPVRTTSDFLRQTALSLRG